MHEPWYPMNAQMKILWVLIWDQTWFWSQIKHLNFNEHFSIINTSLTTIPKMTWILFDIINHNSVGYQKLLQPALRFHLFLGVWNPLWNHRTRFWYRPESYQVRPGSLETFEPSYASSKVKNENDAIRKRRISQPKTQ